MKRLMLSVIFLIYSTSSFAAQIMLTPAEGTGDYMTGWGDKINDMFTELYAGGGSMTWPTAAGLAVYSGESSWSTSLTCTNDADVIEWDTATSAFICVTPTSYTAGSNISFANDQISVTGAPVEIASGIAELGIAEISDGACAAVVTVSATGVVTTDVINWSFNAPPIATTGYNPAGGLLYIVDYPTADNVNFYVCNKSGAAITPGAVILNWRVDR